MFRVWDAPHRHPCPGRRGGRPSPLPRRDGTLRLKGSGPEHGRAYMRQLPDLQHWHMRTELISIPTPAQPLDGAFYSTADAGGSVQLFHGATMNLYVGPPRSLPPVLTERGWNCLAYNRRAHNPLSTRAPRDRPIVVARTSARWRPSEGCSPAIGQTRCWPRLGCWWHKVGVTS